MFAFQRLEADILEVNMPDAVDILPQHLDRVRAREDEMARIIAKMDVFCVGFAH